MVENFRRFRGSENGHKKLLPRNFKFITDARHGRKLDYKTFNLLLSRPAQCFYYCKLGDRYVLQCLCNTKGSWAEFFFHKIYIIIIMVPYYTIPTDLQVALRDGCQPVSSPHPPSAGLLSSLSQRTPAQCGQSQVADSTFPAVSP